MRVHGTLTLVSRLYCSVIRSSEVTLCARAGLKGRGQGQFLLEDPYDVTHDVIVCKSYVFADSQGSRLFFLGVENVLTQIHIQ